MRLDLCRTDLSLTDPAVTILHKTTLRAFAPLAGINAGHSMRPEFSSGSGSSGTEG